MKNKKVRIKFNSLIIERSNMTANNLNINSNSLVFIINGIVTPIKWNNADIQISGVINWVVTIDNCEWLILKLYKLY